MTARKGTRTWTAKEPVAQSTASSFLNLGLGYLCPFSVSTHAHLVRCSTFLWPSFMPLSLFFTSLKYQPLLFSLISRLPHYLCISYLRRVLHLAGSQYMSILGPILILCQPHHRALSSLPQVIAPTPNPVPTLLRLHRPRPSISPPRFLTNSNGRPFRLSPLFPPFSPSRCRSARTALSTPPSPNQPTRKPCYHDDRATQSRSRGPGCHGFRFSASSPARAPRGAGACAVRHSKGLRAGAGRGGASG